MPREFPHITLMQARARFSAFSIAFCNISVSILRISRYEKYISYRITFLKSYADGEEMIMLVFQDVRFDRVRDDT